MERGILGLKTDPKKKIIFCFNGEAWPSDDSEDETYNPIRPTGVKDSELSTKINIPSTTKKKKKRKREDEDGGNPSKPTKKHRKKIVSLDSASGSSGKKKVSFSKKSKKSSAEHAVATIEPGPWGTAMPPEILVKIFKFVIRTEGALQFLRRTAKVCTLWHRVSYHPLLWEVVDMACTKMKSEDKFIWLCKSRLSHMKELNLTNWEELITHKGIQAVGENCPRLTNINLSGCKKLTATDVRLLADSCVNLSAIDLTQTSYRSGMESPVSNNTLKYLLNKSGKKLISLSIANNLIPNVLVLTNTICEHCSNLQVLDMSNIDSRTGDNFPLRIEKLQAGCPKLQVLRLANTRFRLATVPLSEQANSLGFPQLKELSIAAQSTGYFSSMDDGGLDRIVKTSEKLELLDVRGCKRLSTSGLVRIPAWHLQHLFLSQCSATMDPDLELIMQKWRHSLIEVDLSWNNHINKSVDVAINALTTEPETSKLQMLDLCGSSVSFESVKNVLKKCMYLRTLNLTSCRALPRGMKRMYADDQLEQLKEDIESAKFVQYEDS